MFLWCKCAVVIKLHYVVHLISQIPVGHLSGFHLLQTPQGVSEFINEYHIVSVLYHNKIEGLFQVTGSCMHDMRADLISQHRDIVTMANE